jgi:hypothetical protein
VGGALAAAEGSLLQEVRDQQAEKGEGQGRQAGRTAIVVRPHTYGRAGRRWQCQCMNLQQYTNTA